MSENADRSNRPSSQITLRDRLTFPAFGDCPHERSVDIRYMEEDEDGFGSTLARHWCFLGEIVQSATVARLLLDVRDVAGRVVRAAFYDTDLGEPFAQRVKKGHTLALLYPQQHHFMDGSKGFRIEELREVTIIPCSLVSLLAASDMLQRLPSTCWADGCEKETELTACSGCHKAKYCGKEHQEIGWKAGHRRECKAFKSLEWYSQRDWTTFQSRFSFTSSA
ncbi:hypothetical protein WOLCODRAFT_165610 [Wolfiporia cocos MD-104 SS10]|uniref:MYND-type domain-containing protein n=1 Tax=Wolfiporia cocos (strain MD-104) TaxID=742152 RepID=A0A2H3JYP4_WOLCO|nr:hypothetical protein WOLCODRAFT_165610 [Wolfiporia cocos MD-104 SS10]